MIKLRLLEANGDLDEIQNLPGLSGIELDSNFGSVLINPKDSIYIVRTNSIDNIKLRQELSPEIIGIYGDSRISSVQ